jgi:hypothetical protein
MKYIWSNSLEFSDFQKRFAQKILGYTAHSKISDGKISF